ncbi:MAG: ABC transporter permease [Gammaproteobacteria bacterium]|nr:ABC transporter permease [Gammaproteobacteria bacterium]
MADATSMLRASDAPARGKPWVGLRTIILRECAVIARFWTVTLAPPVITTLLYFAIFGEILGRRIGSFSGIEYIRYVSPGLIVLWVIPYAFGHTASGFLGARIFRFLEEILISPLPEWAVMLGYVTGGVIRGVLVGTAAALTTLLVAHLHVTSVLVSVAALLLAALVSSLGGFVTALFAKTFQQVQAIQLSILTPLMYLGGVFNPISMLPAWAQRLALANPLLYMVNAVRYGLLGVSDVPVGLAFWMMGATGIMFLVVALQLLARGKGIRE